jgi:cytochrome c oxidase subunit 1
MAAITEPVEGPTAEDIAGPHWTPRNLAGTVTLKDLLFSDDYRLIALKGILAALLMAALAGLFALTFRAELTQPDIQYLSARPFIGLVTLHGMLMVFGFVIPVVIFIAYYMLPRVLGLERLSATWAAHGSFWSLLLAGLLLIVARPDFTWTFYAPMSLRVGGNLVWMGYLAIVLVGVSEFLAGIVLLRTVLDWRGPRRELPLLGWAMLTEAGLLLFSTPMLSVVGAVLITDWLGISAVFDPARGGDASTFLWMFWFYGHPAVYLPLVPAIGIIYTLLPRFLGRPMWSRTSAIVAFVLLFLLSFGVFHHHFQPNVTEHGWIQRLFQILTLLIIVPSTLHVFNWIASLWQGPIPASARAAIPFKFIVGAIFMIIVGGVPGFLNAQISVDSDFIHNTYWLPGHFHAMFLGFCVQVAIAGIYYLYPYFTGRRFHQGLANAHFWLWQVGIFGQVMMMYALGLAHHPRWVVDYLAVPEWSTPQLWLTVFGGVVGLGFLAFVVNLLISARAGALAEGDPWSQAETETAPTGQMAVAERS